MICIDMVKRRLKLKKILLENKVHEYELAVKELARQQDNVHGRAEFITQLTEEIRQLETVRDSTMAARVTHQTPPPPALGGAAP